MERAKVVFDQDRQIKLSRLENLAGSGSLQLLQIHLQMVKATVLVTVSQSDLLQIAHNTEPCPRVVEQSGCGT